MLAAEIALLATELAAIASPERVIADPAEQKRFLKDFSWYSPLLAAALESMTVDVVVRPRTQDELYRVVALAVRRRVPITVRGAGTGNYGQSLPLERGILVDVRGLNAIVGIRDDSIELEAGTVLLHAEREARLRGREIRVMPSTYHIATAAGFVCGGSGGIGSVEYGGIWDGNVPEVELLTAEDPPRYVRLAGAAANVVLHAYGTTGVVTRVTLALSEAHSWWDGVATFDSFQAAARFAWRLASDSGIRKRLTSLQQAPLPAMFEPVKRLFTSGTSAVLLIVGEADRQRTSELVSDFGGRLQAWPEKPPITQFPFSHTILWAKKHDPAYTWIQGRFSADEAEFFRQVAALEARYGGRYIIHSEFHRLADNSGTIPGSISVITDPDPAVLDDVIAFSPTIGMTVLNPHSYVVQEGGMVDGIEDVLEFKARSDPFGLLNPGKVERRFYGAHLASA